MRVWLDDRRPAPKGWRRVRWPDEAIELLLTGKVVEISLDHDLGNDDRGTGNDVVSWIEEKVFLESFQPPVIHVHSDNGPGRDRMLQGIESIRRMIRGR